MKQWAFPVLAIFAVVGIALAINSTGNNQVAGQAGKDQTAKAGGSIFNPAARYNGNPLRDGKSYNSPLLTLAARHNGEPLHNAHRKSYANPTSNVAARNIGEPRNVEWAYVNPILHPTSNLAAQNSVEEPDTSLTVYLAVRNTRSSGEPRYPAWSYASPSLHPTLARM